jgi:hypothetical protein
MFWFSLCYCGALTLDNPPPILFWNSIPVERCL